MNWKQMPVTLFAMLDTALEAFTVETQVFKTLKYLVRSFFC